MFVIPYSYVFFGLQSIILYTAFIFYFFGVLLSKDHVVDASRLLAQAMFYLASLEIPAWAGGLIFFCLNIKKKHINVVYYIIASLVYICVLIFFFTIFHTTIKRLTPDLDDSENSEDNAEGPDEEKK